MKFSKFALFETSSIRHQEIFVFGLDKPIQSFAGSYDEIKELHELHASSEGVPTFPKPVLICGLGGIGKTEFCRQYLFQFKYLYENIIWITADFLDTLKKSFQKLADLHEVNTGSKDFNEIEKDIKTVCREVYKFFSRGSSIFAFDNADPKENIDTAIYIAPQRYISEEIDYPHFLITSHLASWDKTEFNMMWLEGLKKREAIQFVEERLNNVAHIEIDYVVRLVARLSHPSLGGFQIRCFQLALQQAVSDITLCRPNISISDYVSKFVKSHLKSSTFMEDGLQDSYKFTTYTTWIISISSLTKRGHYNHCGEL